MNRELIRRAEIARKCSNQRHVPQGSVQRIQPMLSFGLGPENSWITSVTARCLHEQSLLLDKTRNRLGRARRTRIVSGTAEQRDRSLGVKFSKFLPPDTLQLRASKLPSFHPTLGDSNLLRCPIGNERGVVVHGLDFQ